MSAVVADTDVVSLIFKRHSLSDDYLDAIEGKSVVLSFMDPRRARTMDAASILGSGSTKTVRQILGQFQYLSLRPASMPDVGLHPPSGLLGREPRRSRRRMDCGHGRVSGRPSRHSQSTPFRQHRGPRTHLFGLTVRHGVRYLGHAFPAHRRSMPSLPKTGVFATLTWPISLIRFGPPASDR